MNILSKYNIFVEDDGDIFVYNTLTRAFLKLNPNIKKLFEAGEFSAISEETLVCLLDKGIIVGDKDSEWEKYVSSVNKVTNDANMAVFLSMTSGCNLNCPYCYEDCRKSIKDKQYISKENIDAFIDYISKVNPRNLKIAYFGGEPTINPERLVYTIRRVGEFENCIPVSHSLITNGYKIPFEIIEELRRHDSFNVQITLDGDESKHNETRITFDRKGSFDEIFSNICILAKLMPNKLTIRINVIGELDSYYKLTDRIIDAGLADKVALAYVSVFDGQLSCNQGADDSVLNLYKYAKKKGCKIAYQIEMAPCIAVCRFGMAVDESLNVYACPGELYQTPIGHIEKNGDYIFGKKEVSFSSKAACHMQNCIYGPLCMGGCVMDRKCRKKEFDEKMPFYLSLKIEKYRGLL